MRRAQVEWKLLGQHSAWSLKGGGDAGADAKKSAAEVRVTNCLRAMCRTRLRVLKTFGASHDAGCMRVLTVRCRLAMKRKRESDGGRTTEKMPRSEKVVVVECRFQDGPFPSLPMSFPSRPAGLMLARECRFSCCSLAQKKPSSLLAQNPEARAMGIVVVAAAKKRCEDCRRVAKGFFLDLAEVPMKF